MTAVFSWCLADLLQVLEWDLSPMTPLTWLTVFYQAACRHHLSRCSPRTDSALESGGCVLRPFGRDDESDDVVEVEKVANDQQSSTVDRLSTTCGCADCFLHVPQYSQRAYLQIVRVGFYAFVFPCRP